MLAIATFYEIWQMDIKIVFLNGFLEEESINGLVQASRSWNIHFDKLIKAYSFNTDLR